MILEAELALNDFSSTSIKGSFLSNSVTFRYPRFFLALVTSQRKTCTPNKGSLGFPSYLGVKEPCIKMHAMRKVVVVKLSHKTRPNPKLEETENGTDLANNEDTFGCNKMKRRHVVAINGNLIILQRLNRVTMSG